MSGQDFPLMNSIEIQKFFNANSLWNFIEVFDDKNPYLSRLDKRNSLFYPQWMLKKIYIYITGGYSYTIKKIRKNKPFEFSLFYGSQWWALHENCLQWMMGYIKNHPEYAEFFKTSLILICTQNPGHIFMN